VQVSPHFDRETALILIAQLIKHEDLAPLAIQNAQGLHTPQRTSRFRGNWGRS
jgi:hypothetical protein